MQSPITYASNVLQVCTGTDVHTAVQRCSRHADSRRRKRKDELKQDAADRDAEQVERAAARQKREEEAQLRADGQC